MKIYTYNEIFLEDAMATLGSAFEYLINKCGYSGNEAIQYFLVSGISYEFEKGNIKYISGMSGYELGISILTKCNKSYSSDFTTNNIDYPIEYWIGWILAYYQWYSGYSFNRIINKISYENLERLYYTLHEADNSKVVTIFEELMKKGPSNLSIIRKNRELSQSQLAKRSGVSIRSIQLYEQRKNNINHAQYNYLLSISNVLNCKIEDILEY